MDSPLPHLGLARPLITRLLTALANQARVEKALELLKTVTDSLTGEPEGVRA